LSAKTALKIGSIWKQLQGWLSEAAVLFGQGVHALYTSGVLLCHSSKARLLLAYPPFAQPQTTQLAKLLTQTVAASEAQDRHGSGTCDAIQPRHVLVTVGAEAAVF
jgi:hypothetical protein